jgi:TolA-binding protein
MTRITYLFRNPFAACLIFTMIAALMSACQAGNEKDYFHKTNKYFEKGDFRKAAATLGDYLDRFPDGQFRDQALFRMGEILLFTLGEKAAAVEYFGALVNQYPAGEYAYRAREIMAGLFRDEARNYDQAILEYKWLIHQKPDNPKAPEFHYEIARTLMMADRHEEAVLELGRIIENYPNASNMELIFDELGSAYSVLDQPETAIYIYSTLIRKFPETPLRGSVEFKIGTLLEEELRFDEAIAIYKDLIDRYPNTRAVEIRLEGVLERKEQSNEETTNKVDYDYRPAITPDTIRNFEESGREPRLDGIAPDNGN